jgi:hypothetical protein
MSLVNLVGQRHKFVIPVRSSGLFAPNQQQRDTPGVEGEENPVRPSFVLAPDLPHVWILGAPVDRIGVRSLEMDALFFQQADREIDALLLRGGEAIPPRSNSSVNSTSQAISAIFHPGYICRQGNNPPYQLPSCSHSAPA